jgi:hypothetical protein
MRPPRDPSAPRSDGAAKTDEVWPWSHLVPFFDADIRSRVRVCNAGWCGASFAGNRQPPTKRQHNHCSQMLKLRLRAEAAPQDEEGAWVARTAEGGKQRYYHNEALNLTK